jgi:hypothetical protein
VKQQSSALLGAAFRGYFPGKRNRFVYAFDEIATNKDAAMPEDAAARFARPIPEDWVVREGKFGVGPVVEAFAEALIDPENWSNPATSAPKP